MSKETTKSVIAVDCCNICSPNPIAHYETPYGGLSTDINKAKKWDIAEHALMYTYYKHKGYVVEVDSNNKVVSTDKKDSETNITNNFTTINAAPTIAEITEAKKAGKTEILKNIIDGLYNQLSIYNKEIEEKAKEITHEHAYLAGLTETKSFIEEYVDQLNKLSQDVHNAS